MEDQINQLNSKMVGEEKKEGITKEEIQFDMICISYD
jgi:hypothetical protein